MIAKAGDEKSTVGTTANFKLISCFYPTIFTQLKVIKFSNFNLLNSSSISTDLRRYNLKQPFLLPKNVAETLVNLYFKCYFVFMIYGSNILISINKKNRHDWFLFDKNNTCRKLIELYYKFEKHSIKKTDVCNAYDTIQAIALADIKQIIVCDLLYQDDKKIYYNIQGSNKFVSIKPGICEIKDKKNTKILFLDKCSVKKSYKPKTEITRECLDILSDLFLLDEKDVVLYAVLIISFFIPNISHPLLVLSGEYGASKSTTMKIISKIIDPHGNNITQLPRDINDTATILHNNYLTVFDNVSYISRDMADLLCIAVTGGSLQKRKLYTDTEITILNIHKPILINGVGLSIQYPDLIDRCIWFDMQRIPSDKRLPESQLWTKFYKILPELQSICFSAISKAMVMIDKIELSNLPRLADFARWGYCIAESLENGLGEVFLEQYRSNIRNASIKASGENPLLSSIQTLMKSVDIWEGNATELLKTLSELYLNESVSKNLPNSFPKSANLLSKKLGVLRHDLSLMNIEVEIGRNTNRFIRIINGGENNEQQ